MASHYGWECSFYLWGACGVVWFLVWIYFVYETPDDHPRISNDERSFINSNVQKSSSKLLKKPPAPLFQIITSVPVIANILTALGQNYGFYTILKMTPTYLNNIQHISIENVSCLSFENCWSFKLLNINLSESILLDTFIASFLRMVFFRPYLIFVCGGFLCHGDGFPIIWFKQEN